MPGQQDGDLDEVPIISDFTVEVFLICLGITSHGLVACFGVFTNVISLVIFCKLGLKDSMSLALLALSCSDFMITILQVAKSACYIWYIAFPESIIRPLDVEDTFFEWPRYIVNRISCWITTAISVERCFCVVFPFKVHRLFTRARCASFVVAIWIVTISYHVPIFMTQRLDWGNVTLDVLDMVSNATQRRYQRVQGMVFSQDRENIELLVDTLNTTTSVVSQVIFIVCTSWMISALNISSKIRPNTVNTRALEEKNSKARDGKEVATSASKLSIREKRLIKLALFLAIYFSLCNILNFLLTAIYNVVLELYPGAYQSLGTILFEIIGFFYTVWASLNFLIYMKFNSSYRRVFWQWLKVV